MKYYSDTIESSFMPGSQPHKLDARKKMSKGRKLHSFKKEEVGLDEFGKHRASYKRAENKNMMRSQLRDIQMAF